MKKRYSGQGGASVIDGLCKRGVANGVRGLRGLGLAMGAALALLLPLQLAQAAPGDTTADRVFGQPDFTSDGTPVMVNGLVVNSPSHLVVDRDSTPNHVYLSDTGNNRVLAWNDIADFLAGNPATLALGQPDLVSGSPNRGGSPAADTLNAPAGIAVNRNGALFVADLNNHRVLMFEEPFSRPTADLVIGQSNNFTTNIQNNGGVGPESLNRPSSVTFDISGRLYVADRGNHRVLSYDSVFDRSARRIFGQGGSSRTGTANKGGVTANSLNTPEGVFVDAGGRLYVTDSANHRVLAFDNPLNSTTASRVFGQGGSFTSNIANNGGISASSLNQPVGVSADDNGRLYIAERGNHRVLAYDQPLNSTTANRVFGQLGSFASDTANNGGVSANSLRFAGILTPSLAPNGDLYLPDSRNNRVLIFDAPSASMDFGDAPASYATLLADDGARHTATGLLLGSLRDIEADAQSGLTATGDDLAASDDEDGVRFGALSTGLNSSLTALVSGGTGRLDAWIDFNRDGDFLDAGEKVANGVAVGAGSYTLPFAVPSGASQGVSYARVRLSTAGSALPTGLAADGEVEDYRVQITAPADGKVQFAPNSYSVAEEAGNAVLTVTRSAPFTYASSVQYSTVVVTATPGSDYTATTGTLNWPAGDGSNRTIMVPILNDAAAESSEVFRVNLSNPVGTQLGTTHIASVSITDTDTGGGNDVIRFAPNNYPVGEGAGTVTLTVTRSGSGFGTASVNYQTDANFYPSGASNVANASDYTPVSGTLMWANGDMTSRNIVVPITNDALVENTEALAVTISNPVGCKLGPQYVGVVRIADND